LHSIGSPALWGGFVLFVLAMLALDLGVFHRKSHAVSVKEAAAWSVVWVSLSLAFGAVVWVKFSPTAGLEFLTGYLIEKSLSVDNLFVFIVVFGAFRIPDRLQHRVLFWGILTALVLRAAMILAGAALLARFHWLMYVFGAFLVFTGIKIFREKGEESHPEDSRAMRLVRRLVPSTKALDGDRFFTVENGKRLATPLFMALMLVEITDVVFALDSIPAIFGVTQDPFIVFTSNIFAILGLRSLFFMLAGVMDRFHHLKTGLAFVLLFVGGKMLASPWFHPSPVVSLAVILGILGVAVAASLLRPREVTVSSAHRPADG
jgi:tellurite resistance protein TerC